MLMLNLAIHDTLAYVVNYGTGWELLSGDERYTPILAMGEGIYDFEELNPGQKIWLESEMEIIQAIKNNDIDNSAYSLTDYNGWYKDGYIFKNGKKIIQLYE